jgi:fluoride exporter
MKLLLVCAGGAVGSGVRYLVSTWAARSLSQTFPWGTLMVNVVGCFLMSLVMHIALATTMSTEMRVMLTTGFLGGLTTYSAFNYETTELARAGALRMAVLNFGITAAGCLAAGLLGLALARRFVPA